MESEMPTKPVDLPEVIELELCLEGEELLFREQHTETFWNIREMDPWSFAALCIAVKRAANERERKSRDQEKDILTKRRDEAWAKLKREEKVNGCRVKLEDE